MQIELREANAADAEQILVVLVSSIECLCVQDYGQDAVALEQWLSNKTLENIAAWISDATQRVVVADQDGEIVGVGAAHRSGEVTLNYVAPKARFRGVSKAILAQLETYLRELGCARCTLSSTRTAHRFYLAAGFTDTGPPQEWGRLSAQPMEKQL